jgi:hypothetical protein
MSQNQDTYYIDAVRQQQNGTGVTSKVLNFSNSFANRGFNNSYNIELDIASPAEIIAGIDEHKTITPAGLYNAGIVPGGGGGGGGINTVTSSVGSNAVLINPNSTSTDILLKRIGSASGSINVINDIAQVTLEFVPFSVSSIGGIDQLSLASDAASIMINNTANGGNIVFSGPGVVDAGALRITNGSTPIASNDLATKAYVDASVLQTNEALNHVGTLDPLVGLEILNDTNLSEKPKISTYTLASIPGTVTSFIKKIHNNGPSVLLRYDTSSVYIPTNRTLEIAYTPNTFLQASKIYNLTNDLPYIAQAEYKNLSLPNYGPGPFDVSGNGDVLAYVDSVTLHVRIYTRRNNTALYELGDSIAMSPAVIDDIRISDNGKMLFTRDGVTLRVYQITGTANLPIVTLYDTITLQAGTINFDISGDGSTIAVSSDSTMMVYIIFNNAYILTDYQIFVTTISAIAISGDGNTLVFSEPTENANQGQLTIAERTYDRNATGGVVFQDTATLVNSYSGISGPIFANSNKRLKIDYIGKTIIAAGTAPEAFVYVYDKTAISTGNRWANTGAIATHPNSGTNFSIAIAANGLSVYMSNEFNFSGQTYINIAIRNSTEDLFKYVGENNSLVFPVRTFPDSIKVCTDNGTLIVPDSSNSLVQFFA